MHGITTIDSIHSDRVNWHGKDIVKTQQELNEFEGSPIDYTIEEHPLYDHLGNRVQQLIIGSGGQDKWQTLHGHFADGTLLRSTFGTYPVIQNREEWKTIQLLIDEWGFNVQSVLTMHAKRVCSISMAAPDGGYSVDVDGKKDPIKTQFNHVWSLDSSVASRWYGSNTRVVCWNTFQASLQDLKGEANGNARFRARKSSRYGEKLKEIATQLNQWADQSWGTKMALESMARKPISKDDIVKIAIGIATKNVKKLSTKSTNIGYDIASRAIHGIGNKGESLYDLFNGITERYTRGLGEDSDGQLKADPGKAFLSSEFGNGAKVKSDAFELMMDDEKLEKLAERGEKLLSQFYSEKELV